MGAQLMATTVVGVVHNGRVALGSDGQVTLGERTIMKHGAKKVRRLHDGRVLAGFAGSAADAFTLFEKFESSLETYNGNLTRAAVELAKEWRTDRMLHRLEALLAVADRSTLLVISGTGDVIEPDDGVVAIGSGGPYALAAARALIRFADLTVVEIVQESLRLAAEICVFTNDRITVLELDA